MMYLIAQTWIFLLIAWLIGIAVGYGLSRDQKSLRHRDTEEQLRDARNRGVELEKELEDFRSRVSDLEGLPMGVRASRVAARDEMVARIAALERDLDTARGSERRLGEEAERLRGDVDGFRTRYLEARAKWDEFQAKAEALASAPQPLNLGEAQVVQDDGMRQRVVELERLLAEAHRVRDRMADQAKTVAARVGELEAQVARAGKGNTAEVVAEQTKALNERIAMLESQLLVASVEDRGSDQSKLLQARIVELEGRLASGFNTARESDALKSRVADLQDKLGEAEVALRKAISTAPKVDGDSLRAKLSEAEAKLAEVQREAGENAVLRTRLAEFEGKGKGLLAGNDEELRRLQTRTAELEKALERSRAQASEAQSLRAQVASLESRLAAADSAERNATGEDVGLLKARLADVEARSMTSSGASMEFESLRSRVMTLESLLHEAAKSRDEAAILRSKVAELDGRLGQAMKSAAESRARTVEGEKV